MTRNIICSILFVLFIVFPCYALTENKSGVTTDRDVISWQDADRYYGHYRIVDGVIVKAYNSGKAVFLNFHPNWKRYFTVVIFEKDFHLFPGNPEKYYLNKHVRVKGIIKEYKGKPEIILTSPDQVEILNK